MKREWAWRTSRRESLRNLEAFRHLLDGHDEHPEGEPPPGHDDGFDTPGRAHDRTTSP